MQRIRKFMSSGTLSMADYLKNSVEAYKLLSHSKIVEHILFNHVEKEIKKHEKPLNKEEDSKDEMGS
jgi:hypothetical protein